MDEVTRIPVGGERPYDVLVGRDLLDPPPRLLPGANRVAVLHAPRSRSWRRRSVSGSARSGSSRC